jgi:predicted ferric reductase
LAPRAPSPTDAELLRTLEKAFAHHAGGDATIDVPDLQKALGLKSEYLAGRVLACFDTNGDGVISKEEFLAGVRELVLGSDRDKLSFAFRLHDHDGDGKLDYHELHRMIALAIAESDVEERASQPASYLANVLLASLDKNKDGKLSFEELEAAVQKRPELLARMTRSEAIWIAPNEELLLLVDEGAAVATRASSGRLSSRWQQAAFAGIWVLANVAVFAWSMLYGRAAHTSDPAMQLGRAIGACLDLNGGVVLLPVMRRMLTWVRARWLGRVIPVDDAIDFHKIVGHALFGLALAHAGCFFFAYGGGHGSALGALSTERGTTGAILLGVFFVMWFFALGFIRRSKRFELFYFTHTLYVFWLVLLVLHGPRILVFSGIAIVTFLVEQILRLARRAKSGRVVSTWPLRSGVTRLEIEKPAGFRFDAGDYVFLRIPKVANHEWHPFTISSAPETSSLTFHVRSLGNWTSALRRHVEEKNDEPLQAFVDGPYGSPSAHIFRARFPVLIGAGIGVTPFASVLESLVLRASDPDSKIEKVHFFWLNRDQYSFEWFRGLLSRLEEKDTNGLLDIHLCMTGARTGVTAFGLELARELMHSAGRSDMITGLRTKTHLGAPDWEKMLGHIKEKHAPAKVDVFFCGPHGLATKLAPLCRRLGMTFREERF